uniref:Virulence-associated protein Q n=1 Tax=Dichelobacter nodosus TaxID=870 RepID=Q46555_DICNO|nr:virulence-associated protein Q [Dichelobacter nodosus]
MKESSFLFLTLNEIKMPSSDRIKSAGFSKPHKRPDPAVLKKIIKVMKDGAISCDF